MKLLHKKQNYKPLILNYSHRINDIHRQPVTMKLKETKRKEKKLIEKEMFDLSKRKHKKKSKK